ncbi:MAG: hypothetical protein HS114_34955 [Anaerolineales bacterium]|nr:hypothetical protein [Anaerolineales bacterium]
MPKQDRTKHQELIIANWLTIAAAAWDGYVKTGRGAIAIYMDLTPEEIAQIAPEMMSELSRPVKLPGDLPMVFFPDKFARKIWGKGGWPLPDLKRMVLNYIPAQQVVVAFMYRDGHIDSYRIALPDDPPPPEAYKMQKGRLN